MSSQKHFILLRGLTRESRHWGHFPDLLKKKYPLSEITLLDLPGAGLLNREKAPLSVHAMTIRLRSLVKSDQLEKGNIVFIGVSLGGMVAMKWAELFPQDLCQIILINSSAGAIAPVWKRLRPGAIITLVHSILDPKNQHQIIFDRVCRKKENRDHLVSSWKKIQTENPVSIENAFRQITAAARFKLKRPVSIKGLVLTSVGDGFVNKDCSQKLARFLNFPLEIHPWAGHELPDDDPEWIIEKLANSIN